MGLGFRAQGVEFRVQAVDQNSPLQIAPYKISYLFMEPSIAQSRHCTRELQTAADQALGLMVKLHHAKILIPRKVCYFLVLVPNTQ